MTWFEVILLAMVEGVTEFLPVSSTGHMILASKLFGVSHSSFLGSFMVIVQLGAMVAVLNRYKLAFFTKPSYWRLIGLAFLPTVVIGFVGYKLVKTVFLGNVEVTMMGLLVGGVMLLVYERFCKGSRRIDELSTVGAVQIGVYQSFSIIPGISRSAATIIAGQLAGLSRRQAVEFSFLLGLPVMIAATGYDLIKTGFSFSGEEWSKLAVGLLVAYVMATICIDWLVKFVEDKPLKLFGWYRVILASIYFTSLLVFGR